MIYQIKIRSEKHLKECRRLLRRYDFPGSQDYRSNFTAIGDYLAWHPTGNSLFIFDNKDKAWTTITLTDLKKLARQNEI